MADKDDERRPGRGIPARMKRLEERWAEIEPRVKEALAAVDQLDEEVDAHGERIANLEGFTERLRARTRWLERRVSKGPPTNDDPVEDPG